MIRPTLEVADILRVQGERFIERSRSWLTWAQTKVLYAIQRCRTAALGGHRDRCLRCGHCAISYNSCRNRHCPQCQTAARNRWLAERSKELLPVGYVHVVFTLPHQLAPLAYQNKRLLYRLLFQASAATLLQVAADPKHLGAEIGFLSVLRATLLPICRQLLPTKPLPSAPCPASPQPPPSWSCPVCGGPLLIIERLTAEQLVPRAVNLRSFVDTS